VQAVVFRLSDTYLILIWLQIKTLDINDILVTDLSVVANYVKHHASVDVNGVLGQGYLTRQKAVIDIGNNRMFVKR
jgi:hypothetical protein